MKKITLGLLFIWLCLMTWALFLFLQPKYVYSSVGNTVDKVTDTRAGYALMGGGNQDDDAFRFLINRSGGGDIVVLCARCDSADATHIYSLGNVNSVQTISFLSRKASSDPFVLEKIRHAEALFIAGGDQAKYIRYWKGTPVEDAINTLVAKNVPIGGSSAGLAILGNFSFTALHDTALPEHILKNPYFWRVTLDNKFLTLPLLYNVITDTHFDTRDRMGRLIAFLGRIAQKGWTQSPRGIGIDEGGAVLIEADGSTQFVGKGAAYFIQAPSLPEVCAIRKPLSYANLSIYRMGRTSTFNIVTWTGTRGTSYSVSINEGTLSSTQSNGAIY